MTHESQDSHQEVERPIDPAELGRACGDLAGMLVRLNMLCGELEKRVAALEKWQKQNAAAVTAAGGLVQYGGKRG